MLVPTYTRPWWVLFAVREGWAALMTRELAQAIANYDKRPNFYRREIVVALVRDGHLTPLEYKRLQHALKLHLAGAS